MEKVEVIRELNATEVKQVSGGNTGLWTPIGSIRPTPTPPKPYQA
jgi:hypothetical protein